MFTFGATLGLSAVLEEIFSTARNGRKMLEGMIRDYRRGEMGELPILGCRFGVGITVADINGVRITRRLPDSDEFGSATEAKIV